MLQMGCSLPCQMMKADAFNDGKTRKEPRPPVYNLLFHARYPFIYAALLLQIKTLPPKEEISTNAFASKPKC